PPAPGEPQALLGVRPRDSAARSFPSGLRPARPATIAAAIRTIRGLHAGDTVEISGNPVCLATANGRVPIFLAASQPRMLALAGRLADGVASALPRLTADHKHIRTRCESAGAARHPLRVRLMPDGWAERRCVRALASRD